mgnify:CR=1 FL=1
MKNHLLLAILVIPLFFISCNSKEKEKNDEEIIFQTHWVPTKIQLVKIIPLYTINYPHTENCAQDYIQLNTDETANFVRFSGVNCEETIYQKAFVRNGEEVSLNIMGHQINGMITLEDANTLLIESDIVEYTSYIEQILPDYSQYLSVLNDAKVTLELKKKEKSF